TIFRDVTVRLGAAGRSSGKRSVANL
ncbi:hypothetical protein SSYM_0946, partial [Serratia symbiotica str. Tucson]